MKSFLKYSTLFLLFLVFSCKPGELGSSNKKRLLKNNYLVGNSIALEDLKDTTFVNLKSFSPDFSFDMKYASKDNFLKKAVYDCPECYLRYKAVKQLIDANKEFQQSGYTIKIFDCYRPMDIQKKMWKLFPNADYVADPNKGSIHNRGCAIDITLIDKEGKELDMGTAFDFFGPEASHKYQNFSDEVLKNRSYLKEVMVRNGFKSFESEWWHYNLVNGYHEKLANFTWECK